MAIETVKVPDLGGAEGVEVIEIAVSPGDEVAEEDTLLVLESDKASMDVPSPVAGVVKKIVVNLGDTISEGTPIVEIEVESASGEEHTEVSSQQDSAEKETEVAKVDKDAPASTEKPPEAETTSKQALTIPDLGTGDEVDVIELEVAVGDQVEEGDTLMTLEGDKATMDVPSPLAGKILSLTVKEGDKVSSGLEIGSIEVVSVTPSAESDADDVAADSTPTGEEKPHPGQPTKENNSTTETQQSKDVSAENPAADTLNQPEAPAAEVYAGPVVRQFARELGIDLRNIEGSGARGRIQKKDVKAYVKAALQQMVKSGAGAVLSGAGDAIPGIPDQDFSKFGEVEEIPLSKIARLTATNMRRTWLNVPAVTQFDDADITEMEAFRKSLKSDAEKRGTKLTPVAFLMKACAAVLADNPVINRSWHSSGEKVIQKHYVHIGMAVATPAGLLVPVVRDVDKKGIFEIAEDIALLADKARDGKLSPTEMQGGCFSISSLGAIGGKGFTPIVNAPEAAILGVSKASIQPVWNGKEFEPRQMLPLSLSYDHKLVNGADAGKFLTDLVVALGDMRRLLL